MSYLDTEEMWRMARNRLSRIYGMQLPDAIESRFSAEKAMFRDTGLIRHYRLAEALRQHHITFNWYDDNTASTFLAWIYHVSPVNPLPAHTVCPHCHRTVFRPEKRSGWDLPPIICECGAVLRRDGHDIPLDWLRHEAGHTGLCPRIAVREEDAPMLRQLISDEYGDLWKLVAYEDVSEVVMLVRKLFNDNHDRHHLLIPSGVDLSYPQKDGVYQIPGIPASLKVFISRDFIPLSICIRTEGQIHEYNVPELEEPSRADVLMTEEVIRPVWNHICRSEFGVPSGESVLNITDLPDFTSLTQAGSLLYGGNRVVEFAERLIAHEGVSLQDLPTSIEDLCRLIVKSTGNYDDHSLEQADCLMSRLFDDRQCPLTASMVRNLFSGMDIPEWLPEYLEIHQCLLYRFSIVYHTMNRLCREYGKASGVKEKKNSDEN